MWWTPSYTSIPTPLRRATKPRTFGSIDGWCGPTTMRQGDVNLVATVMDLQTQSALSEIDQQPGAGGEEQPPVLRAAKHIHVQQAIVHKLPGRGSKTLALSDFSLDLAAPVADGEDASKEDPKQKVTRYLQGQVEHALKDGATVRAEFMFDHKAPLMGAVDRLLDGAATLIDDSQELARQLAAAIGDDDRIKPGHLAVCRCRAENWPGEFLALIKIDLIEVLVEVVKDLGGGHHQVQLDVRGDALATLNEKLQKAALVGRTADGDYQLLMLDRQVKGAAAEFFSQRFLFAEPMLDPKKAALKLAKHLAGAYHELVREPTPGEVEEGTRTSPLVTSEQAEMIRGRLRDVFYHDKAKPKIGVDLDAWAEALPIDEAAKQVVREDFIASDIPRKYRIDAAEVQDRFISKRTLIGDHGVRLEFDAIAERAVIKSIETEETASGTVSRLEVEVRNLKWLD